MLSRRFTAAVMAALAVLVFAGSAGAQPAPMNMAGQWFRNTGPLVDIPINGGPGLCIVAPAGPNTVPFFYPPTNPVAGCAAQKLTAVGFRPRNGGVPAGQLTAQGHNLTTTVMVNGTSPATFTVGPNVFAQNLGTQTATVAIVPTVVQLSTRFDLMGPIPETGGANPDRVFSVSNWVNQTGRLAANFSWCPGTVMSTPMGQGIPGPGVVGCTNPIPAIGGGAYNGLVKYTGGANAFGGTMSMFLDSSQGFGSVQVIVGTTGGIPLLGHSIISGSMDQIGGQGYAAFNVANLMSGPINLGFGPASAGQNGVFITTSGPTIAMIPADKNYNWGFPFTTGTVFVQNIEQNQGQPGTTTWSVMGTDSRTGMGRGNITLVSGTTSHRVLANQNFAGLDVVQIRFLPEPGATLMLAASLAAIGALYRVRRRALGSR